MNQKTKDPAFQASSGNVFADMGLEDADQLYARVQLGFQVRRTLKEKGYTQNQAAELLNIKQSEISNLMRGKYHLFPEGQLIGFLNRLNLKVVINISEHHDNEPFQQVLMGI